MTFSKFFLCWGTILTCLDPDLPAQLNPDPKNWACTILTCLGLCAKWTMLPKLMAFFVALVSSFQHRWLFQIHIVQCPNLDPVLAKSSPKRSFSVIQNERFGLIFAKTGSIISGTGQEDELVKFQIFAGLFFLALAKFQV
jgi:hypothetical protein